MWLVTARRGMVLYGQASSGMAGTLRFGGAWFVRVLCGMVWQAGQAKVCYGIVGRVPVSYGRQGKVRLGMFCCGEESSGMAGKASLVKASLGAFR